MKIRTSRTIVTAVCAVAAIGILASIASAAIPSANGTLVGCYAKKGGALRLTDSKKKCSKKEARVAWAAKGPQGAPGLPGAKGDQGPKGDMGPSNAFSKSMNALTPIPDAPTDIMSIDNLPAGSYVFNFTGDYKDGAGGGILDCAILAAGGQYGVTQVETEAGRRTNVAMTGAVTLAAPGSLTLRCDDNNSDESMAYAHLTAIQVGTLTAS